MNTFRPAYAPAPMSDELDTDEEDVALHDEVVPLDFHDRTQDRLWAEEEELDDDYYADDEDFADLDDDYLTDPDDFL